MKIYAKQVPPEYQETPFYMDEQPENVYIFGNRHFRGLNADTIENIENNMYDAADELKRLMRGEFAPGEYSLIEILNDFLQAENGREYSRADRLKWRALLLAFDAEAITLDDALTAALELMSGKEYKFSQICGCCQGDWNNIIYPAEYGREWLNNFEVEYFNTGAEWRIAEGDPDGDDGYYFYSHAWSDDGIRAEIATAAGVDPSDVVLYAFDTWSQTGVYREVI